MKVTVCIPSIPPRAKLLRRAVASVLAQEKPAHALCIAIDHDRLGAAATRNETLFAARTEWVAFLDDDDEMQPQHLRRLCEVQAETGADVVFPWFDVEGGTDPFPTHEGRVYDPQAPHSFPVTTLVRRSLAYAVGGFPPGVVGEEAMGEDWQFWIRLRDAGAAIVHLPERTWTWHHDSPGGNTAGLPSRW